MKTAAILMIFLALISACKSDMVSPDPSGSKTQNIQQLKLTSYRVSSVSPATTYTGNAMPMQESYFLKDATHYYKTRTVDGKTTTVSGTYTQSTIGGDTYYILSHESAVQGQGPCPQDPAGTHTDQLRITPTGAENFMSAFDGPDLTYQWVSGTTAN